MSKFTTSAATAHTLSITAMEEASRLGLRTADIDHMLIALTVNEQLAGQLLRRLGITIDATREAVSDENAEQLAALGIRVNSIGPERIVFHETGGYEWSKRALDVINNASEGAKRGDAGAVLRELVIEPSGTIQAILHRLDTTPELVTRCLDEAEQYLSDEPTATASRGAFLSGTSEAFIPAAPEDVWSLLSDPARLPEWEAGIGTVDTQSGPHEVGMVWEARSRTHGHDGKALRVKLGAERQEVRLSDMHGDRLIEWNYSYPDLAKANSRRIRIEMEPVAGGTRLHITLAWVHASGRERAPLFGLVMRPLYRFIIWLQLSQISASISRVFR